LAAMPAAAQEVSSEPTVLTLEDALKIALSENISVKVADKEIERTGYARKGSYASLFPQIDASGSYSRTIKKQVMYMDFDMSEFGGMGGGSDVDESQIPEGVSTKASDKSGKSDNGGGIEVGRWNTFSAGVSASMPIINAQLWQSIKLSGQDVELAVEKARSSRLETVTQVKQAFYGVLLAKEAFEVYKKVYENAMENLKKTEQRYNVGKASELEYVRSKSTVQNAIPNVYDSESGINLALWQLKAVMGIGLDEDIDVAGCLADHADNMVRDVYSHDEIELGDNSTMRQLALQSDMLNQTWKLQKLAYVPSISLMANITYSSVANDPIKKLSWFPYSYAGLTLTIPIFSGFKRLNDVRQAKNQYFLNNAETLMLVETLEENKKKNLKSKV
ncbi:MAG: TolC family protein, partial [Oscillospiraceae bacterium]|nr:TolC family protein [Oscillospiraceae bacterium]